MPRRQRGRDLTEKIRLAPKRKIPFIFWAAFSRHWDTKISIPSLNKALDVLSHFEFFIFTEQHKKNFGRWKWLPSENSIIWCKKGGNIPKGIKSETKQTNYFAKQTNIILPTLLWMALPMKAEIRTDNEDMRQKKPHENDNCAKCNANQIQIQSQIEKIMKAKNKAYT